MLSIDPLVAFFFSTGLAIGIGHCSTMCGPIVIALSLSAKGRTSFVPHLLYNAGRILTYGVLGAAMGAVGSFTTAVTHLESIQKAVMIATGAIILIMGVVLTGWVPFLRRFRVCCSAPNIPSKVFQRVFTSRSQFVYLPLGLLLGLLPCGPVYTALVAVTRATMEVDGTGQAIFLGMMLMLAFGLGTAPTLLVIGKLADAGWHRNAALLDRLGAVLMILIGIYFTVKGVLY